MKPSLFRICRVVGVMAALLLIGSVLAQLTDLSAVEKAKTELAAADRPQETARRA